MFPEATDAAVDALKLPLCCEEHGMPQAVSDHFTGRARKFRVSCPKGHVFQMVVWAPTGERWSRAS